VRAVDDGDALLLIARDGVVRRLDGDSAGLARAVLEEAAAPRTRAELHEAIAGRAGADADAVAAVVDQAIEALSAAGALVAARDAAPVTPAGRVVLAVTGAVAAVHTPALALALERRGWTVEIALSRAARRFVPVNALAAITHRAPHTSMWPASAYAPVPHLALAEWADLVVVCPASATTLSRLAAGDFSDLVAAVALATRAPVVLVPSMNPAMREAAAVQRNLERLAGDGFLLAHGAAGIEVAERPGVRAPVGGAAPPAEDVAAMCDALWRAGALRRREPTSWNAIYAATPEARLPWASPEIDADLAAALAAHAPPPRPLLDVGTGLGVVARHAAALGYAVVALDIADTALELARARSGDAPIVWLRDDICAPALAARFGAVVDRGCLHVLPRARHPAWAAAMHRLVAPGGVVLAKAFPDTDVAALLGDDFEVVAAADSTLPGPRDATPAAARLTIARRK
jgi:3-polyprenyl-4-hydroxybenzoate decarboxylase